MSGETYLWIKALHVIAVISWMAGLLYLPRLFVYHCEVEPGSATSEKFKVMERRLLKAIMLPAAVVAWGAGLTMAVEGGLFQEHWFHVKLLLVVLMTIAHHMMTRWKNDFAADRNHRPQRFFRIANEVPTLLMIFIVILVITKPF
ncbi:protoporphyrinogen oxidase HemJ [Magnetospirillum aberrantis]|uniref:Protoporphyrinogen IX oxidase n=1 Tax=Magnetospirillum aberrantis SpK TaxID=908842 RepID=A0A7C9UVT1_9PROT|nr:protoporphyrinogen oxidase HemJ [Magnetospirillum aberrantis]NFV81628.1 protoporphyrinogen oxidase HemJ [Magnetospirillum aberrantis SpK]